MNRIKSRFYTYLIPAILLLGAILPISFSTTPGLTAQTFTLELEEISIPNSPAAQSFAWGQHQGKWIIIGGRTDGLHQRQPFASFLATGHNTSIYVIDPNTQSVWSQSIASLTTPLQEQLQSTNMNFTQRDCTLYINGGYGYSPTAGDHITYDGLIAIDLAGLSNAMINNTSIAPYFRLTNHPGMAVTGGQMERLGDTFYLIGGQKFMGRYNPHGPTHGPGFIQEYTNEIRTFEIIDNGTNLTIQNYQAQNDTLELHRRDYNLVPQIFPDGRQGFTAFSGVFQYGTDLPWLNVVNIDSLGYQPVNGFEQLFNQYHSARLPVFDATLNQMHTVFFGGIGQYYFDDNGTFINDVNVPFVKTISKITRYPNDSLVEYDTGLRMPGFLGASAEFIRADNNHFFDNGILNLNTIPPGNRTLAGYIFGGIESTQENIFFINTGTQSQATTRIFKVFVQTTATTVKEPTRTSFGIELFPNPGTGHIKIIASQIAPGILKISIADALGKKVWQDEQTIGRPGHWEDSFDLSELNKGVYWISLEMGTQKEVFKLVLH